MNIKKDDNVIVISGNDKGKEGKVLQIINGSRLVIEGVNIRKHHQKSRKKGEQGQIIEKSVPIHASNVMLMEGGKRVRVAYKVVNDKKVRVSKKTGREI